MEKDFPKKQSHEVVYCIQCGKHLNTDPKDHGYPPGNGQFGKQCDCGFITFYDLQEVLE